MPRSTTISSPIGCRTIRCKAGDKLDYRYRLYWTKDAPFLAETGHVVASRRGRGGRPAEVDKLGLIKYAIDFEGGDLASFKSGDPIEPVISVSRGEVLHPYALRVNTTNKWRLIFDLKADGTEPVEMRVFLRKKIRRTAHRNLARAASAGGGVGSSINNESVVVLTDLLHIVNEQQPGEALSRASWLHFEPGKGGHLLVRRGDRKSVTSDAWRKQGARQRLWLKILKDLELKDQ